MSQDRSGYDARRNPDRGVRVQPMPKHMHEEFMRFLDQCTVHAQSHLSTWRLADRTMDEDLIRSKVHYWKSVISHMNTLRYLGTTNAKCR